MSPSLHRPSDPCGCDRPAPQDGAGPGGGTDGVRGRRALLTAGATAALGAFGVAAAGPAQAAAGGTFVLGRPNSSGGATTALSSSSPNALHVRGSAGNGVYGETGAARSFGVRGANTATTAYDGGGVIGQSTLNHGVKGTTKSNTASGVWAVNQSGSTGSENGCAVLAQGRYNTAVIAETRSSDVYPAVYAVGGDGAFNGTALQAAGTTLLDGYAQMLRPTVAVLDASGALEYAPLVSGEMEYHSLSVKITLDTDGTRTVDLKTLSDGTASGTYTGFVKTVYMKTLKVQLTAVGEAMPNLYVTDLPATDTASTFRIMGGPVGSGKVVHVLLTAERRPLSLASGASAPAAAPLAAAAPARGQPAPTGRGRVPRPAAR